VITLGVTIDRIGGAVIAVDDTEVQYAISVQRGRATFTDQGAASTMRLNLLLGPPQDADYLRGSTVGNTITLSMYDAASVGHGRFRGQITDIELAHPQDQPARALITAVGALAQLNGRAVGYTDFPEQDVRARIIDVGARVGVPVQVNTTGPAPTLAVYDAQDQRASTVMQEAASSVGGMLFDTPDGEVVFQQHADRANLQGAMQSHGLWQENPQSWKVTPGTWLGYATGGVAPTLTLPCETVIYEPTWRQFSGALANDIRIEYAGGAVKVTDSESQAAYGQRSVALQTSLAHKDDALDRAADVSRAFGTPRYMMDQVQIIMDRLPADVFDDLTQHEIIGRRVMVTDLPQPAPATSFIGICEGVTEDYAPGRWTMTLALTPQQFSYAMLAWEEPDPSIRWMDATCSWEEAIRIDDLTRSA